MPEDNSEFANKKYLKQRQNSIILAVFFCFTPFCAVDLYRLGANLSK